MGGSPPLWKMQVSFKKMGVDKVSTHTRLHHMSSENVEFMQRGYQRQNDSWRASKQKMVFLNLLCYFIYVFYFELLIMRIIRSPLPCCDQCVTYGGENVSINTYIHESAITWKHLQANV